MSEKVGPIATLSEQRGPARWRREAAPAAFAAAAVAVGVAAAALLLTWLRLFRGMDLRDESFYILVPWRWALGDKPFVQEQNLAQIPGFVMYPFVKLFAVLRSYDVTGYVLYMRHLYLFMSIGVAIGVSLSLHVGCAGRSGIGSTRHGMSMSSLDPSRTVSRPLLRTASGPSHDSASA